MEFFITFLCREQLVIEYSSSTTTSTDSKILFYFVQVWGFQGIFFEATDF